MREWTAAASAQKQFLAEIAAQAAASSPELSYTRVVNGFSAPLDPRGVALLERDPDVRGVYPVRAAFPASLSSRRSATSAAGLGRRAALLPGFDGTGVTIACSTRASTRRTRSYVVVSSRGSTSSTPRGRRRAARNPRCRPRSNGTGRSSPDRRRGRPGRADSGGRARRAVLPIRVAGWQPDADRCLPSTAVPTSSSPGSSAPSTRTATGRPRRGAGRARPRRRALRRLRDGPLAQAVAGAARPSTRSSSPQQGTTALPAHRTAASAVQAGAPDAIAVGAEDGRGGLATVRVMVRAGLHVLLRRRAAARRRRRAPTSR